MARRVPKVHKARREMTAQRGRKVCKAIRVRLDPKAPKARRVIQVAPKDRPDRRDLKGTTGRRVRQGRKALRAM